MRVNLKIIQVISDALIPVLGYVFWEWDLFFILLYYLLDLLVSEVFMHLKTRSVRMKQGGDMFQSMGYIAVGMVLITTVLLLVRIFILQLHPEMNIQEEIIAFWQYKDMGIEQGFLLIPLVVIVGYQRYKMEFIAPRLNERISVKELWKGHLKSLVVLLTFVGIITGLSFYIVFAEWVYLIVLLVVTSFYQLTR